MTRSSAAIRTEPLEVAGMLRSLKDLEGYKISATDGSIGKIYDFFIDDEFWTVRYVVADTGQWLPGRKVLLAPSVLLQSDWRERSFSVGLTRGQIESSPDIDTDKPVSRQRELELRDHYGWPYYWTGISGVMPMPMAGIPPFNPPPSGSKPGDPHLRSVREIIGYGVRATDGDIGKVSDFIADDESWIVRYLVVATSKWLPGRKVLISPQWLVGPISWSSRKVTVIMSRASIKSSPEFEPHSPVNRDYERQLYDFYGRPAYWS